MSDETLLLGREVQLVIGSPDDPNLSVNVTFNDQNSSGIDVSGFDIDFEVEKTLKPEPNTCSIKVYNLAENYPFQPSMMRSVPSLIA